MSRDPDDAARDAVSTDGDRRRTPAAVNRPANVLVLAPDRSGETADVCHDLMATAPRHERAVVYLLFARPDGNQVAVARSDGSDGAVVIDAVPDDDVAREFAADAGTVESVPSPSDLPRIGVALDRNLPPAGEGGRVVVCVRSLTDLLRHVETERAYRFLTILTGHLASLDARAHYHLDPTAHDDRVVTTLASLFDAVIEVASDGTVLVRRDDATDAGHGPRR